MNASDPVVWQLVAKLAGWVGVFLLGMTLLTEGLKALAGPGMRRTLQRLTGNTVAACFAGIGMTVLTQASSATVLATIGFVTAGILTLKAAIPVVVGATVGTSSTSWLVASVGLTSGAAVLLLPALAIGAFLRALGTGRAKQAGTAIAGLALMLLSIGFIRETVGPVVAYADIAAYSADAMQSRLALVGIGLLLGTAMQSSAATIALAMVALHDGALNWDQAAHLTIGATIGTTSTGLAATIGARPAARRTAVAWTLCALAQAGIAFALFWPFKQAAMGVGALINRLGGPQDGALSIAAFHTEFTALGALPVLLLDSPMARLLMRIIPQRASAPPIVEFDRSALSIPSVAAVSARRGIAEAGVGVAHTALDLLRATQLRSIDDRIGESLASLNAARDFIGEIQVPEGDHPTAQLQLASVGALDHLTRMVGDMQHLAPILRGPAARHEDLGPYFQEAATMLAIFSGWLANMAGPSPAAALMATSKELSARRKAQRAATLVRTASGAIPPDDAMEQLEALRQVDRLVHHAARAAEYLSAASTSDGADATAARTPGRDLRDEPT